MSRAPTLWRGVLAAALVIGGPGCRGCDERPGAAAPPTATAPATAAQAADAPAEDPAEPAPTAHPLATGWARSRPPEPHPEARGLYRRALDRVHAGDPTGAARLFAQLREDHAGTRFAARIRGGGDPAATAALLGLGATVAAAVFVGAIRGLEARGAVEPPATGGP